MSFLLILSGRNDGDEAVPQDQSVINFELSQKETVEPLNAHYFEVVQAPFLL